METSGIRQGSAVLAALTLTITAGCSESAPPDGQTSSTGSPSSTAATSARATTPGPSPTSSPTPAATPETPSPSPTAAPVSFDPRNKFFDPDERLRTSPWFDGRGRVMIGFGCTEAPWYNPSSKCRGGDGFHHGIDVALPCGTPVRSAVAGTVVGPGGSSRLGSAYGSTGFLIRDSANGRDVIIGHSQKLLVSPGQTVTAGQQIALAGANGAPDGCHLHLEVRPSGGSVGAATDPSALLALDPS